ncbi:MAG: hypothetical protein MZV49_13170 [Rhodopseudomonas palustris]|nr:hypothetical protein [Rhodopseudomonas palustris]
MDRRHAERVPRRTGRSSAPPRPVLTLPARGRADLADARQRAAVRRLGLRGVLGRAARCASSCRTKCCRRWTLPRGVGNSISSLSYYALVLIGPAGGAGGRRLRGRRSSRSCSARSASASASACRTWSTTSSSGLILMFERPIQPGDVVEVVGHVGHGARDRHARDDADHVRGRRRRRAERHAAVARS